MREKTYRILFLLILAVMINVFGARNGRTASFYFLAAGDNVTIAGDQYTDGTATRFKLYYDVVNRNEACGDPNNYPNNYNGTGLQRLIDGISEPANSPIPYDIVAEVFDNDEVDPSNVLINLSGLTIGKKYCFAVTASNGQAESEYSNVAFNTPRLPAHHRIRH